MKVIKYNDFKLNEKSIEELGHPDRFKSEFSDDTDAVQDLKYYTDMINNLQENGGLVYRLIFLEDVSNLDTDDLGEHWCLEYTQLSNFYDSLNSDMNEDMLPYYITGYLKPGQINEDYSYGSYEELPHELEVNLISDPEKYELKIYRDTIDADQRWENKL